MEPGGRLHKESRACRSRSLGCRWLLHPAIMTVVPLGREYCQVYDPILA